MRLRLFLAALACSLAAAQFALAEDFRVETRVFEVKEKSKDKTPLCQNITLFHAGKVYDYLAEPPEIVVFDKANGRFVLLDPVRKLRTDVSANQVLVFCGELRSWAVNEANGLLKFSGNPRFAVQFAEKSNELTMASEFMTYKLLVTEARTRDAAHQMREFSDWYARLNALTNAGGLPPFPRLAVNEELDRRGFVATAVELNILSRNVSIRSEHELEWRLLDRDLKRISDTNEQIVNFKSGNFGEFMRRAQTAKR